MKIDRKKFFEAITPIPLPRPRRPSQVKTLDAMIDEAERRDLDLRVLAYMMATALREVGSNLAPVREWFAKTDAAARAKARGKKYGVVKNGQVYYGRGLVQVTWDFNYKRLTEAARKAGFDVDFVNNPDLLLEFNWAVWAMFEGMLGGFYGPPVTKFFTATVTDWRNARRSVNVLDHADEIAGNAKQFYADLLTSAV